MRPGGTRVVSDEGGVGEVGPTITNKMVNTFLKYHERKILQDQSTISKGTTDLNIS